MATKPLYRSLTRCPCLSVNWPVAFNGASSARPRSWTVPPPTKGYCAAKDEAYFGFKGGLRITDYGLIVHAPLLQAYGHDSTCRDALLTGVEPDTQVVGDSAFLDLERQQELKKVYQIQLLTPLKSNMHLTPERQPFVLPGWTRPIRRLIETVYAQLVERFHVQRLKVRDTWHLLNLWGTKDFGPFHLCVVEYPVAPKSTGSGWAGPKLKSHTSRITEMQNTPTGQFFIILFFLFGLET